MAAVPPPPGRPRVRVLVFALALCSTLFGLAAGSPPGAAAPGATAPGATAPGAGAPAGVTAILPRSPQQHAADVKAAQAEAPVRARQLGLDARETLRVRDVIVDGDGTVHTRYERRYAGLEVVLGDFVVHRTSAGVIAGVDPPSGTIPITLPTIQPAVPASRAAEAATASVGGRRGLRSTAELVVYLAAGGPRLAWRSTVTGTGAAAGAIQEQVVTDASSNRVLDRWSLVETETGTGRSLHSGSVPVEASRVVRPDGGMVWELRDQTRGGHFTLDALNSQDENFSGPPIIDGDNVWGDGSTADPATVAADAQYDAAVTWDYYNSVHGRSGIRGDGKGARSRVHFVFQQKDGGPNQASWSDACFCMSYGDGDGRVRRPLVSLDIGGHEMTHGVTSATARLVYRGESGGLNEATSDIFGTAVEFYAGNPADPGDYLLGEKVVIGSPGWLRRMDQPHRDGLSDDCWTNLVADHNPHLASGVGNHFFYLLAEGSGAKTINGVAYNSPTCLPGAVTGIGLPAAARIWYRALVVHMTPDTDYGMARTATIAAARELYGPSSTQCLAVERAWDGVNVAPTPTTCAPVPPPPTGASPNDIYNALFNDYGNSAGCADWSGADGTQSVRLPSGRRAWFFSDSYLGAVNERPGFFHSWLRNSIVIQQGGSLRTITGGNTCRERDQSIGFFDRYANTPVADASGGWYWSGDARVVGSEVIKFYYRNDASVAPWIETNTAIARISTSILDNASVLQMSPTPMPARASFGNHPIIWGTALTDGSDGLTYIYGWGVIDGANNKRAYLARVAPADLANPAQWQYNSGGGNTWSARGDQAAARPLAGGPLVEAGFSVVFVNNDYWLVQHEPNLNGGAIVAHPAADPWGFTTRRVALYQPPETPRDAAHKYQYVYETRFHPQLSGSSTTLTFSYNVNTSAVSVGCRTRSDHDGAIYRPRFIDVPTSAFDVSAAKAPAALAAAEPSTPAAAVPLDGRGLRQPPAPPVAAAAAAAPRGPAAGAQPLRPAAPSAALAADNNWYDQWSAAVQANHGCPRLDQATTLTSTVQPDGQVNFDWNDYGRDIWYWSYFRDVSAGQAFQQRDLFTIKSDVTGDFPVRSQSQNGHTFAWYVVPFATGDQAVDRNGDGKMDNEGPASNVVQMPVTVAAPAAPTALSAQAAGSGTIRLSWAKVTYPSDKVYYWIYRWDSTAGQTIDQAQPLNLPINYTVTSVSVTSFTPGHNYGFYVKAQNLGGYSPPSEPAGTTAT